MRSMEPCCASGHLLSCVNVDVDPDSLLASDDISINGVTLQFANLIPPHARVYRTDRGDEAVISYDPNTGAIFGSLKTEDGRSFALEKCGNSYIFEEFDMHSFGNDESMDEDDNDGEDSIAYDFNEDDHAEVPRPNTTMRQGKKTFSMMFYYTPEFASVTPDIAGWIDLLLAETNQGYANSGVPIEMVKFCQEEATAMAQWEGAEGIGPVKLRMKFMNHKGIGKFPLVRNSADAAVLLVNTFPGNCGIAQFGGYKNGRTFSVAKKSCAMSKYSFAHEVAHNFGASHDYNARGSGFKNTLFPEGHGHLIEKGFADTGESTIMAYQVEGHEKRVNYYSNPDIVYPGTGTPTGVAGVSNNAAVLLQNVDTVARIGDESAICAASANGTNIKYTRGFIIFKDSCHSVTLSLCHSLRHKQGISVST